MSFFESRLKYFIKNKLNIDEKKLNCIPFDKHFPQLSNYVPGLIKGTYYAITAFSNVGKTPLTKYMFLNIPYEYYKNNVGKPNAIKLKIIYFCLEESKAQFYDSIILSKLHEIYNIDVDFHTLNSYISSKQISVDTLNKIKQLEPIIKDMENCIEIISHIDTPTGIHNYILNYAANNGNFYLGNTLTTKDSDWDNYKPIESNEFVIIVTDHINSLATEPGCNYLSESMHRHSTDYMTKIVVNKLNYIVCDVHQQALEGENATYAKHNENETSIATLGDNKRIVRNYHVLFGLNMPSRYGTSITKDGYDLRKFKNSLNFRTLLIHKNRFGPPNIRKSFWFNPTASKFTELPNHTQINYVFFT